jgi:hypothetical protein
MIPFFLFIIANLEFTEIILHYPQFKNKAKELDVKKQTVDRIYNELRLSFK